MIGQAHGSLYDANSLFAKRTCNSFGLPQPLAVLGLPYSHTRCAIPLVWNGHNQKFGQGRPHFLSAMNMTIQIISDIAAVVNFVNRLGVEECLKNGQDS